MPRKMGIPRRNAHNYFPAIQSYWFIDFMRSTQRVMKAWEGLSPIARTSVGGQKHIGNIGTNMAIAEDVQMDGPAVVDDGITIVGLLKAQV